MQMDDLLNGKEVLERHMLPLSQFPVWGNISAEEGGGVGERGADVRGKGGAVVSEAWGLSGKGEGGKEVGGGGVAFRGGGMLLGGDDPTRHSAVGRRAGVRGADVMAVKIDVEGYEVYVLQVCRTVRSQAPALSLSLPLSLPPSLSLFRARALRLLLSRLSLSLSFSLMRTPYAVTNEEGNRVEGRE
jgi:hypothetical protein